MKEVRFLAQSQIKIMASPSLAKQTTYLEKFKNQKTNPPMKSFILEKEPNLVENNDSLKARLCIFKPLSFQYVMIRTDTVDN